MMQFLFSRSLLALTFLMLLSGQSSMAQGMDHLNKRTVEIQSLALLSYSEKLASWQKELANLYQEMAQFSRKNKGAIDPRHLVILKEKVKEFHKVHLPRLEEIITNEPNFLSFKNVFEFTNSKTKIDEAIRATPLLKARTRRQRDSIRFHQVRVNRYEVNPNDEIGSVYWGHFKNQFLAKIILLETYVLGLSPFIETDAFRSVLIRDVEDDATVETLEDLWFKSIEEMFKRDHLVKALSLYEEGLKLETTSNIYDEVFEKLLDSSVVYKELNRRRKDFSFFRDMAKNMAFMAKRRWDTYKKIGISVLFEGSRVFGNVVGMFQSRQGYLHSWTKEEENEVAKLFRPLDILMEKTPFRLTDRFIPGHFGHAAIWIGTEEQLREIGVWDKLPDVFRKAQEKYSYKGMSFQKSIQRGHRIIEALRPGVQFNTFRHFLEIDDLAALRMRDCEEGETPLKSHKKSIDCLNNELKREYILKAFEQVGKDYDFAFDVNTEKTIVCSELIYRSYLDVDFEISLTAGQHNISPDQIAAQADDEEDPFAPFLFYHQGKKVEETGESLRVFMKNLMFP
ncbi:MAG: hypothetical protein K9K67_12810 [Bacteriovoracaceae bacterium]|nr:hypothetical protein [Bacteriovoracaceae bacterium]